MRVLVMALLLVACGGGASAKKGSDEGEAGAPSVARDCAILNDADELVFVDCADLPKGGTQ